jgi:hypothetical protein
VPAVNNSFYQTNLLLSGAQVAADSESSICFGVAGLWTLWVHCNFSNLELERVVCAVSKVAPLRSWTSFAWSLQDFLRLRPATWSVVFKLWMVVIVVVADTVARACWWCPHCYGRFCCCCPCRHCWSRLLMVVHRIFACCLWSRLVLWILRNLISTRFRLRLKGIESA